MVEKYKHDLGVLILLFAILMVGLFSQSTFFRGDTSTYTSTIAVLRSGIVPSDFQPNRIISTFGNVESIRFLSFFTGNIYTAWIVMNSFFFLAAGYFFYRLCFLFLDDYPSALFGVFLFATNYIFVTEGLSYLTDIAGWTFFIASFYFISLYWREEKEKYLFCTALLISIGGLFKEYGFLPFFGLVITLVYFNRKDIKALIKKGIALSGIAFLPVALVWLWVYRTFHYSYLNWTENNIQAYGHSYSSRILEFIKVYGSLYHFGWFLFIGGAALLLYRRREVKKEFVAPLILMFVSACPLLLWPAITQRILFITLLPFMILSAYFFKMTKKYWYGHFVVLLCYLLSNIFMVSYILPHVNVDSIISAIRSHL